MIETGIPVVIALNMADLLAKRGIKIDIERLSMLLDCPIVETSALKQTGLDKLIAASYRILGLISYLTAGETETRAWTIVKGTKAPQAAGKIHSDFERGFIRAEVVNYQDLLDCGSYTAAKEKGLVGLEGKEYVVKDGDVILFRFNV
jgi:ribosome-binding ATPase YchF (GTP1/OBG family)